MIGFLQSLVARGSGASAPGSFQFATLPSRPLPQAQTWLSPNTQDAASASPTQAPLEVATPHDVITPAAPSLPRPAITVERTAQLRTAAADAAPHASPILPKAEAVSSSSGEVSTPAPRVRKHPTAPVQTPLSPTDAASLLHTETIQNARETSREEIITQRREAIYNAHAPAPSHTSPVSLIGAEPLPAAAATLVEIGRIEIVLTQPPVPPARQDTDRTRGFAGYEQRRLGPRR